MNIAINSIDELEEVGEKLKTMLNNVTELSTAIDSIRFLTIKEVTELTGWNLNTTRNVFNRPDFPSCDFGKEKVVEIHAFINYFSVPRRRC